MKPLLAKSYNTQRYPQDPPAYALLSRHSRDVAEACSALSDLIGKIGLEAAGLENERLNEFKLNLKANGWLQDLGKASSHFQEMLNGSSNGIQLLRHETISGLLAYKKELPLRDWLEQKFCEKSLLIIIWAAMGHHRKFDKGTQPKEMLRLIVNVSHPDFRQILNEMSQDLGFNTTPIFERDIVITQNHRESGDINAQKELRDLQDEFEDRLELFTEEKDRRYLGLIKGLGIAADVAASAVAKKEQFDYSLTDFIEESLSHGLKETDFDPIIKDKKPYPFQIKVAESPGFLTFAEAGCGSGKSLAAYLWARNWCRRFSEEGRKNFRLFFCLPTTGTTTEHFKDYALESGVPPEMLSLSHSRSSVDLQTISKTSPEEEVNEKSKDPAGDVLRAEQAKIESLNLWSTPLVVATSDTVLGVMSNSRKSVYSLPSILSSAIVFDEIHAFDDCLFGHLLVFLKSFPKLPVLLMTASLPAKRLEAIRMVRPDLSEDHCIQGDKDFAEIKRYSLETVNNEDDIWAEIEDALAKNHKILWVKNQVDWANKVYSDCKLYFPDTVVNVYHSRLKYKHRSKRHRKVIDDFNKKGTSSILVATQVAEMSLDLSADLLITDIAPIPSLIQRLGRLNRRLMPTTPIEEREVKSALIYYLPEDEVHSMPYSLDELTTAINWVADIQKEYGGAVSQKNLSDCFEKFSNQKDFAINVAEERAVFFSGLWQTYPGLTRGKGYTISVILESDFNEWKRVYGEKPPNKDWLREHEVAIPIKDKIFKDKWEVFGGLRVAKHEAINYDYNEITNEGIGAQWRK